MLLYTVLALLLSLLPRSYAGAIPECTQPPPPASSLPSLSDCLKVVSQMTDNASKEGNSPQVWSRSPRAPGHGYWLPYIFSTPDPLNSCEFIADAPPYGIDIFATKYMAYAAKDLIVECLVGSRPGSSTLGAVKVGPRKLIQLTLRRSSEQLGAVDNGLGHIDLNGTDGAANLTSLA